MAHPSGPPTDASNCVPGLVVKRDDGTFVQRLDRRGLAGAEHELGAGHAANCGGAVDERKAFVRHPEVDLGHVSLLCCAAGFLRMACVYRWCRQRQKVGQAG